MAREAAFDAQMAARALERAVDGRGLSATARAVIDGAVRLVQLPRE